MPDTVQEIMARDVELTQDIADAELGHAKEEAYTKRREFRAKNWRALLTEIEQLREDFADQILVGKRDAAEIERLRRLLRNGLRTMDGGVWVPAYRNEARAYFAALKVEAPDDAD